jgi:putative flippase GtrA
MSRASFVKIFIIKSEKIKFLINGLIATSIHLLVLYVCVNFLMVAYYGLSNFIGAVLGTAYSFLGNKFYVFKNSSGDVLVQSTKFIGLYSCLAVNHGAFLYYWSDFAQYNYILGFLLITILNTVFSFFINKYKVFA